ncbi:hypothetical protein GCM10025873_20630 [Demequina sediminis]|uniref:hypothetical protein n=1 Tax=Demequina sediminis TaxID=1930058 RepID=UPI0025747598|nr:hypothetical protein [Demequina sediminis]BDZ62272.1 hypothetical protein GCM10025873_20630 [Demequina sediminis]
MARWQRGLAVGAALVAGAALGFTAYLTVVRVLDAASPAAAPAPTASSTPTATPTGDGTCHWVNLPEDAKPPVAEQAEGLPEARLLTDAVWDCVDDTWVVETRRVETDGAPIGGRRRRCTCRRPRVTWCCSTSYARTCRSRSWRSTWRRASRGRHA